ncbi:NUDIX domain-containing protein [Candidatus Woesearchaeota archaeon]|nr:NUDIX domain-containing protein [Candidatus Woesearchaeota archaeon]
MREIATAFLTTGGKILILRRSKTESFSGKWGAVSGGIEEGEHDPLDTALREVREETGLLPADLRLLVRGDPYVLHDSQDRVSFIAYPFLFEVTADAKERITLNGEHDGMAWIRPEELDRYDTVMDLYKAVEKVFSADVVRPGR